MSQGATTPKTQHIKYQANHSGAVLIMSIHTHKHRANHSSAILLVRMSEGADLPNSVKQTKLTLARTTSSATHVTEVFIEARNCLLELV